MYKNKRNISNKKKELRPDAKKRHKTWRREDLRYQQIKEHRDTHGKDRHKHGKDRHKQTR